MTLVQSKRFFRLLRWIALLFVFEFWITVFFVCHKSAQISRKNAFYLFFLEIQKSSMLCAKIFDVVTINIHSPNIITKIMFGYFTTSMKSLKIISTYTCMRVLRELHSKERKKNNNHNFLSNRCVCICCVVIFFFIYISLLARLFWWNVVFSV